MQPHNYSFARLVLLRAEKLPFIIRVLQCQGSTLTHLGTAELLAGGSLDHVTHSVSEETCLL